MSYKRQNKSDTIANFTFKYIKSLFYNNPTSLSSTGPCQPIVLNQTSINAPICQVTNTSISFSNVKWSTYAEGNDFCWGTITTYEYLLPAGWSIGSNTSNGSTWISEDNSVTITSDLSTGHNTYILVRPRNSCASGLSNGYAPTQIYISRPGPTLSITGAATMCYPNSYTYTLNGVPSGSTVSWPNTNSYYNVTGIGNTASVTPTSAANGSTTINATVKLSCGPSYDVSTTVSIGAPYVTFNIVSYPYEEPSCYEAYGFYTFQAQQATGSPNTFTGFQWGWRNLTTNSVSTDPTIYGWGYSFFPEEAGDYEIWVKATNECGASVLESVKTITVVNFCYGMFSLNTSPNPTQDELTVNIESDDVSKKMENEIVLMQLYDFNNKQLVKQWNLKNDKKEYNLNVKDVRRGKFVLQVIKGKYKQSKQVILN